MAAGFCFQAVSGTTTPKPLPIANSNVSGDKYFADDGVLQVVE